jgi:hypothetical protein
MILLIIQTVIHAILLTFFRTCVVMDGKRIPRIIIPIVLVLSLIPILGILVNIIGVILLLIVVFDYDTFGLIDNRFTRYWLNK